MTLSSLDSPEQMVRYLYVVIWREEETGFEISS